MDWQAFLFSWKGRIGRAQFWLLYLIGTVIGVVLGVAMGLFLGREAMRAGNTLTLIALVPMMFLIASAIVRRLHDRNRSGWWLPAYYAVYVGGVLLATRSDPDSTQATAIYVAIMALSIWAVLEVGVLRGTVGENRFGPDPIEHVAAKRIAS
jgi:uncharacterized membrane protein YhaH (DUF805 family)